MIVNKADAFAFLQHCVVSKDPISPQPQAWLQGVGGCTAGTDEFVSVIKAQSTSYAAIPQIHTHFL